MSESRELLTEKAVIDKVKTLLSGRVNDILSELRCSIPAIEFSSYLGAETVCPSLLLSLCERTEKERLIFLDAYSLTIAFNLPETPESEMNCYTYAAAVKRVILENPTTFKPADVDKLLMAVQLWNVPQDDDWQSGLYNSYRDSRAVDETVAMIRNPKYSVWKNHAFIAGLERGDIAWQMWWHEGDPAELVEAVSQSWNALIADTNGIN